jgi:hypothetical protein
MSHVPRAAACLAVAAFLPVMAQDIQRCEAPDGRISYANGPCPPGTTAVRTLPPSVAPSAADRQAAQQRARRDAREAVALERTRKAAEERAAREHEQAQAKAKKHEAHCRRLETRLRQAQEELAAATLKKRTEAQRRVKRAEELYAQECGTPPR